MAAQLQSARGAWARRSGHKCCGVGRHRAGAAGGQPAAHPTPGPCSTSSQPACPAGRRRPAVAVQAAPKWNPQNTDDPVVMPTAALAPEEAVRVQLDALRANDEPWDNHGIQTAYEFALDAGGMDRAMYFGFSKDLYHFDHFLGMFNTRLGPLLYNQAAQVVSIEEAAADSAGPEGPVVVVVVDVTERSGGPVLRYRFEMAQKQLGRKKGAWMTRMLTRMEEAAAA